MGNEALLKIAGFAGSLRKGSFNRALLRAAAELGPGVGLGIRILDLGAVPLYNGDVEAQGLPEPVMALRAAVAEADGLLIVTPEYNAGVPAVTKNAVDWLSRPPKPVPLAGKPVAIAGASPGGFGTVRCQIQLRTSLSNTGTLAMPQPEVYVSRAHEKIDAGGNLSDPPTRESLARFLAAFGEWIRRLR